MGRPTHFAYLYDTTIHNACTVVFLICSLARGAETTNMNLEV